MTISELEGHEGGQKGKGREYIGCQGLGALTERDIYPGRAWSARPVPRTQRKYFPHRGGCQRARRTWRARPGAGRARQVRPVYIFANVLFDYIDL